MKTPATGLASILLLAASVAAQCPSSGLVLSTTGGRLGDPFSVTLSGTPSVSGLLAFDVAGGPSPSPIGSVCLGLTPALSVQPFALDGAGNFAAFGIVPLNPALDGLNVFMQAAAFDATQPGNVAISNGARPTLKSPRIYFMNDVFGGPLGTIASWVSYDVASDTFGPAVPLPSAFVADAVTIPDLGWVAISSYGTVTAFDGATGAVTLTLPANAIHMAVDGTTLFMIDAPAAPALPVLRSYSLPLGTPGLAVPLPAGAGSVTVASGFAYVGLGYGSSALPVHVASGTVFPQINLGGPGGFWLLQGGIIYYLVWTFTAPAAVNAIDTAFNTAFFPAPVPLPFTPTAFSDPLFRHGPGSVGPALYVRDPTSSTLLQLSPWIFAATAPPIPIPPGVASLELSNGGTEWLLCGPSALQTMNPSSHVLTQVAPLANGGALLKAVRSATLNKAYFLATTPANPPTAALIGFNTDPSTALSPPVPFPIGPYGVRLIRGD